MTETIIEFYLSYQKLNHTYELPPNANLSKQTFEYYVNIDISN
jgi:hypothetical protein